MHPKIEAVFPHVLPFSEEEIWNKLRNEKWYGFWDLVSSKYWIDFLEKYPHRVWRIPDLYTKNCLIPTFLV